MVDKASTEPESKSAELWSSSAPYAPLPEIGDRVKGAFIGELPKDGWFVFRGYLGCAGIYMSPKQTTPVCQGDRWVLQKPVMPQRCGPCSRAINSNIGRLR